MVNRNPWNDVPELWKDEKAFLQWLRSQTRRVWSKHPVKNEYKKSRRYKAPVGKNDKEVWVSDCEICGKQSRETQVDHIIQGGSFTDWESYTQWAKRILWVTFDSIRELCVDCHACVTLSQKKGITFEEALIEKRTIEIMKTKTEKVWLVERGVMPESSAIKRRQQVKLYLQQQEVLNNENNPTIPSSP